jgi:hypothetical protein
MSIEPRNSGWTINGEGRDLKLIKNKNKKSKPIILVSINDNSPIFFNYSN